MSPHLSRTISRFSPVIGGLGMLALLRRRRN